jgi:Zn-dependent protease with chaperone function
VNLYVSLIRTGIPALVGWLVALASRHGLGLDGQALNEVLVPVAAFCYYAAFRLAEEYVSPRFGWLLGYARPPQYDLAA